MCSGTARFVVHRYFAHRRLDHKNSIQQQLVSLLSRTDTPFYLVFVRIFTQSHPWIDDMQIVLTILKPIIQTIAQIVVDLHRMCHVMSVSRSGYYNVSFKKDQSPTHSAVEVGPRLTLVYTFFRFTSSNVFPSFVFQSVQPFELLPRTTEQAALGERNT
jgi:hypothetical protein